MESGGDKNLRNAVKNAKTAFYKNKSKQKKTFRKEERKQKRLEKKAKQHQFQLKKSGKEIINEKPEPVKKKKKKRKQKTPKTEDGEEGDFDYERYAYEAANKQDEIIINSLGKKLGLNKSQSGQMKGFDQDGLDYLLEVCEPLTGKEVDGDDSDEEYLKSKKAKKAKTSKVDKSNITTNKKLSSADLKDKLLFDDGTKEQRMENDGEDSGDYGGEDTFEDELDADFAGLKGEDEDDDEEGDENISDFSNEEEEQDMEKELGDVTDEEEENEEGEEEEKKIEASGKYIPPALRKLKSKDVDEENVKIERLRKQLKGLLNRVSDSTLPGITGEIELLYEKNSRNTMNELMYQLVVESCIADSLTPQRLIIEIVVIVAALHKTSHCEIGSYFLQMLVEKFAEIHKLDDLQYDPSKQCANVLFIILTMYNYKIVDSLLIYDIVRRLMKRFNEQDIELILMTLKACGVDMRKDYPGALKEMILEVQAKSISSEVEDQSRVKFMLETINALKNNNMRKVPQYDPTLIEEGRKIYKHIVKGRDSMNSGSQLKVSLDDLLNAREKGKWWVIGSAWTGRGPMENRREGQSDIILGTSVDASSTLLEKAKKQRMNTDLRKNIFCVLMTSEDYLDAFEKLQKLNLKEKQGREIIHVLLDCCLQEKSYNPYYAHLADQFCEHSHSNKVTLQYSIWDRFKTLSTLPKHTTNNLAHLLAHLIVSKSLTLAMLKTVSFGVLDKQSIRFFTKFFKIMMLHYPENSVKLAFKKLSGLPKLAILREGLKIFIRHFLTPTQTESEQIEIKTETSRINKLLDIIEAALDGQDYIPL